MEEKRYIIDSINDDLAICEDENKDMVHLPVKELPSSIYEGCIIVFKEDSYKIAIDESEKREEKMQSLFDSLKKK